jgi:glycosyltransferase involved in cell wall biosynthesis
MLDTPTTPPSATLPLLCVVIPVFNEEPVLPELLGRLNRVLGSLTTVRWEVVFVDDGSRDRTAATLGAASALEPRLKLVRLSRNFGHQPALTAGLAQAGLADAVVTMDADLQDPPELIPELVAAWQAGAEVVLAVRRTRKESGLRRVGFNAFHRWFQRLSDFKIEANTGTFGLLARPAVAALNALEERHRFFPGLRAWVGFKPAEVFYDRQERAAGTPGQTLHRLVRYALDGVFSFSYFPLRMTTYIGMFIAGCGFAVGAFFVMRRLMGQEVAFTGFTTLVTLILFLGGVQLIGIGVLGEYLGRIYDEVKRRPLYVVRPPSDAQT